MIHVGTDGSGIDRRQQQNRSLGGKSLSRPPQRESVICCLLAVVGLLYPVVDGSSTLAGVEYIENKYSKRNGYIHYLQPLQLQG